MKMKMKKMQENSPQIQKVKIFDQRKKSDRKNREIYI